MRNFLFNLYKRLDNTETLLEIAISNDGMVTSEGKALTKAEIEELALSNLGDLKNEVGKQLDRWREKEVKKAFARFDRMLLEGNA